MDPNYAASMGNMAASGSDAAAAGVVAFLMGFFVIFLVIILAIYIYMAICLMKMAKKTNTPNAWFAWIPILNTILMIQIAKKPIWWIILFFIPIVNIVIAILIWMGVAKQLGKPEWMGVLMIVPIANFIIAGYLAFSKNNSVSPQPIPPVPPVQPIV